MFRLKETLKWTIENFQNDTRFEPTIDIVNKPAWLNPNVVDFNIRQDLVSDLRQFANKELNGLDINTRKLYQKRINIY